MIMNYIFKTEWNINFTFNTKYYISIKQVIKLLTDISIHVLLKFKIKVKVQV